MACRSTKKPKAWRPDEEEEEEVRRGPQDDDAGALHSGRGD